MSARHQHEHVTVRKRTDRAARWFDNRLGLAKMAQGALKKIFPNQWSFLLGEIALYSFVVLLVTGVFLTFFYDASTNLTTYNGAYAPLQGVQVSQAYASGLDLSFDVRAGLVMRQMHHWAALVFVAAIIVHLARVFFTGAFRRPRGDQLGDRPHVDVARDRQWICRLFTPRRPTVGYRHPHRVLGDDRRSAPRALARLVAVRRRVPGSGHHPALVRHSCVDRSGRHRGVAHRAPRDSRPTQAHPFRGPRRSATTTWSASGCGRRMRSRPADSSSSSPACLRPWRASRRSIRSGSTVRSKPRT